MSVNSQSKFRISACSALGDMSSSHAARATTRAARSPRVARPQFHPPTRRVLRAWVEECRVVVKARLFLLQAQPLSTYVIRTRPTQSPLCRIAVSGAPRVFWLGTHLGAHLPPSIRQWCCQSRTLGDCVPQSLVLRRANGVPGAGDPPHAALTVLPPPCTAPPHAANSPCRGCVRGRCSLQVSRWLPARLWNGARSPTCVVCLFCRPVRVVLVAVACVSVCCERRMRAGACMCHRYCIRVPGCPAAALACSRCCVSTTVAPN